MQSFQIEITSTQYIVRFDKKELDASQAIRIAENVKDEYDSGDIKSRYNDIPIDFDRLDEK